MINYSINKEIFKFKYLPDFAGFLFKKKLREFVTVGIRFSKEADLPLLKPLSKYSEEELVELSIGTNGEMLLAISTHKIVEHLEVNIKKWVDNSIGIFDSDSVTAADLTLGFYLRRKIFSYFLDSYTKNVVEQKFIIGELDFYTTQEELITLNIFSQMQRQKLEKANEELELKSQLLIETQELAGMGSYLINFKDRSKSIYTCQYFKILEIEKDLSYDDFIKHIHPDDKAIFLNTMNKAYVEGGELEMEYRYITSSGQKRIWTKGIVELSDAKPVLIKGTIRDITKRYNLIQQLLENDYLYKQAQELTLLGNWSWTLSSGKLIWSDEMYKIYDVKKGTEVTFAQAISYVNEEYREQIKKQLDDISDNKDVPREGIYKITTEQGIEKVLFGISKVETNHNNLIVRIYGTCQDITRSQILKEVLIS